MTIRSNTLISILVLSGLAMSGHLFASGKVTFEGEDAKNSPMSLEYLDNSKMRMDMPARQGGSGYMIMRDGKAYVISDSGSGLMVMDMAQIGSMAKNMGAGLTNDTFKNELLKSTKLGRTETIAGYKGEVYSMTWRDSQGTHTEEAVLSGDSDVLEYTQAWKAMADIMASAMGHQSISDDSMWHFLERENKGMLRLGKEFRVVSIDSKDIDPFRFVLPAEPMQMPSFGAAASSGQQGTDWGSIFGQKADQHSDRQQQRVERKTDYAVDRTIDKAVDGALKGLLGW